VPGLEDFLTQHLQEFIDGEPLTSETREVVTKGEDVPEEVMPAKTSH
jgi:hypothetical protein